MSLINEALKKAQQQRSDGSMESPLQASAAGFRSEPRPGRSFAALAVGAVLLVGLSVAGTMYLVRKPTPPAAGSQASTAASVHAAAPAATPAPLAVKAVDLAPASSAVEGKALPPPVAAAKTPASAAGPQTAPEVAAAKPVVANPVASSAANSSDKTPAAASTLPAPQPAIAVAEAPAKAKVASSPPALASSAEKPMASAPAVGASAVAAPAAAPKLDERIHAFVEGMRVAGVKAAGADSRVLMNDKVYRLNDFVDRTFQLRLVDVQLGSLTFSDANGQLYVKYF